jgi:TPR repeat protein
MLLVGAGLLGTSGFFFIRNADRNSDPPRVSVSIPTVATSGSPRVIPQALPTKFSEYEADNVVSAPMRKLMESAASGDVKAQISLADRYRRGDSVRADKVKAATWYIIAGTHGSERAKKESVLITHDLPQFEIGEIRFNLGKMYSDGIGGQRDLVSAYSWFALAQAAGDVRAQSEQEKLEHVMTDAQTSEAFHRASEWLAAHRTRAHHARDTIALVPPNK